MGIPGLLKEIGKGERIALSKLAVEFLERHRRPIRIAIDIAIWQFQSQAGQGGQNPALRTFYYRLVRLLALPIHPLFVYDGPLKPLAKRGKVVSRYGTTNVHNELSKKLLQLFRYPYRTAPGEAEAECALLQREKVVDAVMSEDVDTVMWGSTITLRDWSQEGTRGNKTPTHVSVLRASDMRTRTGLDPDGMILVAMLSGGDYAPDGIPGFGPGLACEIAKAGFGSDLLEIVSKGDAADLAEWKERLQYELESNESGYFKTKHRTVKLPVNFPDENLLRYYTHPMVSTPSEIRRLRGDLPASWTSDIDIPELRHYVAQTFNWHYKSGAHKFIRSLAPALLARRLLGQNGRDISSSDAISDRRMHFVNGGIPELRVAATPADIVGFNFQEEEATPASITEFEDAAAADEDADTAADNDHNDVTSNTAQPRKKSPWDPQLPEKMWIPETIVKLGVPDLVEEWEQEQRDKASDPRKFIASKARKTNSSTAATQQTRSINTYFAASKVTATGHRARDPVSPQKKVVDSLHSFHSGLGTRQASTATRRKVKSFVNSPASPPAAEVNPFSIASLSRASTMTVTSSQQVFGATPNTHRPSVDDASIRPIRRRVRPLQKSKTMPCTFEEEANIITISSSPISSISPPKNRVGADGAPTANQDPFATVPFPCSSPLGSPPDLPDPMSESHRSPTKAKPDTATATSNLPENKTKTKTSSNTKTSKRPGLSLTEIFLPFTTHPFETKTTPTATTTTSPSTKNPTTNSSPSCALPRNPPQQRHQQPIPTPQPPADANPEPTSKPNRNSKSNSRTITILPRSSLPGTWKEVSVDPDPDDLDSKEIEEGSKDMYQQQHQQKEKKKKKKMTTTTTTTIEAEPTEPKTTPPITETRVEPNNTNFENRNKSKVILMGSTGGSSDNKDINNSSTNARGGGGGGRYGYGYEYGYRSVGRVVSVVDLVDLT